LRVNGLAAALIKLDRNATATGRTECLAAENRSAGGGPGLINRL
jgi:hypothetical protein